MIGVGDFRLLSVQAVVFTPSRGRDFRTSDVVAPVLSQFAGRYDGEVESTPLVRPQSFEIPPGEVAAIGLRIGPPAVTLASRDNRWKFEATPARTDSFWFRQKGEDGRQDLAQLRNACVEPLLQYPAQTEGVQMGRVAFVVRRYVPVESAARSLAERFCLPELVSTDSGVAPFRNSQTFKIENLKKYERPVGGVNSWVRCSSGLVDGAACILVEQDINTLAERQSETRLTVEGLQMFYDWVTGEMDSILNLYFGERPGAA